VAATACEAVEGAAEVRESDAPEVASVTRLQATVALLQAWLDYFPWPETWTGELQRRATNPGIAPSRRVICEDCEGRGKTRSGWMCSTCKGRGRYDVDDYTLEIVDSSITPWSQLLARFVNCDVCGGWGRLSADSNARPSNDHPICDTCVGTGKVPGLFGGIVRAELEGRPERVRQEDGQLDALTDGYEKRDELSIYKVHLLPALHNLHHLDRQGHFLVEWVWIMGAQTPISLRPEGTVRLVAGTRAITAGLPDGFERRLPPEIRAQVEHRTASLVRAKGKSADRFAQRARDEEIRRLHHRGASLDELAARFHLDKSRISRITRPDAA
jgi:hypothetical protein